MTKPPGKPSGHRQLKERVKTAKKRKVSSTRWLQRQLNDPYVHQAKRDGYRSRAAYKLIELNEKFHFLKPGKTVLDLGAAPGGWTQVAVAAVGAGKEGPQVVGIDLLAIEPIAGATLLQLDFMHDDAPQILRGHLPHGVDIVLSDMAPNTIGHAATDHLRIMVLLEATLPFACEVLKKGGVFIAKVFQGGAEKALLAEMRKHFALVKHAKPKASRSDSSETYVVAMDFKGRQP